jgi:hypothetical protein
MPEQYQTIAVIPPVNVRDTTKNQCESQAHTRRMAMKATRMNRTTEGV